MRTASALLAVVVSAGVVHAEPPASTTGNPPAATSGKPPAAPSATHVDPFATNIHIDPFASNIHVAPDPFSRPGFHRVEDPAATRRTAVKVVAITGLGLVAGAFALSAYERSDYDHAVSAGNIGRANSDYDIVHYAGTGMFVAGVAALGTALVLRATLPEKRTVIAPALAPGQAGFVLARGF